MSTAVIATAAPDEENETIIVNEHDDEAKLRSMTDAELIEELFRRISLTAESFMASARVIRLLDERRIDTSHITHPLFTTLRKIAYGQILPDLVVHMGEKKMFNKLAALPLPDQKRIVDGEPLKVVTGQKPDDSLDFRLVPFDKMSTDQKNQVFGKDGIRTEDQQWQEIKGKTPKAGRMLVEFPFSPSEEKRLVDEARRQKVTVATLCYHAVFEKYLA